MNTTTEKQFEKLAKHEQTFRWALFLASDGYERELSNERVQEIKQRYLIDKKPLPKGWVNHPHRV